VLNNKFWHCAHVPFIFELNPNLKYRGGGCQIGRGNKKDMISLLPVGGCSESGDVYSDMDFAVGKNIYILCHFLQYRANLIWIWERPHYRQVVNLAMCHLFIVCEVLGFFSWRFF
jgi:hypothetical protein